MAAEAASVINFFIISSKKVQGSKSKPGVWQLLLSVQRLLEQNYGAMICPDQGVVAKSGFCPIFVQKRGREN
ncbi:hypothetical protein BST95_01320 [Halioglobus japonicus]|nr:hypothetical protein BST95_01320 [Halioglobus japonicus]